MRLFSSSGIVLKEEYNKTAEYLLTRPLTRSEIFISKLAVLALNVFLLNLVTEPCRIYISGTGEERTIQDQGISDSFSLYPSA